MVAANTRNEEDGVFRRTGCYLDAESGLMMGAEWLRMQGAAFITQHRNWDGDSIFFSPLTLENGSSVVIVIKDLAPGTPAKTVVSRAMKGTDIIQFSWEIGAANTSTPPTLSLNNWRSP